MKITEITSEVFEWERPGIWNGGHFYGPGRLHKVTVQTDEGITGYGWNGGTAPVMSTTSGRWWSAATPWTPAPFPTTWARN